MINSLLKLGVLLVIGIISYNYFLGTPEEKAQSKAIINKVADVGKAGLGLLKDEYQKLKDGKYDDAFNKIGRTLNVAKDQVNKIGGEAVGQIESWEEKKNKWQTEKDRLEKILDDNISEGQQENIKSKIKELMEKGASIEKEGEQLVKEYGHVE